MRLHFLRFSVGMPIYYWWHARIVCTFEPSCVWQCCWIWFLFLHTAICSPVAWDKIPMVVYSARVPACCLFCVLFLEILGTRGWPFFPDMRLVLLYVEKSYTIGVLLVRRLKSSIFARFSSICNVSYYSMLCWYVWCSERTFVFCRNVFVWLGLQLQW